MSLEMGYSGVAVPLSKSGFDGTLSGRGREFGAPVLCEEAIGGL